MIGIMTVNVTFNEKMSGGCMDRSYREALSVHLRRNLDPLASHHVTSKNHRRPEQPEQQQYNTMDVFAAVTAYVTKMISPAGAAGSSGKMKILLLDSETVSETSLLPTKPHHRQRASGSSPGHRGGIGHYRIDGSYPVEAPQPGGLPH